MIFAAKTLLVAAVYDYGPRVYFEILARAGGGGGGGGGRGGSSGGGSSGGGSSGGRRFRGPGGGRMPLWLIVLLVALFGGIIFLVIFMLVRSRKRNKLAAAGEAGGVSKYANKPVPDPAELAPTMAKLREHDGGFDEARFLGSAQEAFMKVQASWTGLNSEDARPLMGEACFTHHETRINEFIAKHEKNALDDLEITEKKIMGILVHKDRDEITVRFNAQGADYAINTETGDVVRGNKFVGTWVEDWQFERVRPDLLASGGKSPAGGLDANWRITRIDEVAG